MFAVRSAKALTKRGVVAGDEQSVAQLGQIGITVRAAMPGEAPAISEMSTGHIAHQETFIAESFERRTVLVACEGDALAGFAVWDRAFFGRPFVWLLGVAPNYRRRGIATRLLHCIESACPDATLFTSTNESNHAMQALLLRLGYVYSGRVDHLDAGDPELFYSKRISPKKRPSNSTAS